ncbi:MAG: ketopantoate reductase family protein [Candidatus Heimdallarchaeota archaeon]
MNKRSIERGEENYNKLKIAIIGAGPSGGILATHLAKNGENVILVDILQTRIDAIRRNGLSISGFIELHSEIPHLCYSISELAPYKPDVIFIAVKTSVLKKVITEIQAIWGPGMKVISYQNGLDNELLLAKTFGNENVLRVVINYAGNVVGDANIEMTFFNKPNFIGIVSERVKNFATRIAHLMTEAELETEFTENIKWHTWKKTILNSSMSPLCAITNMTMHEALDFPETRILIEEALKEGILVAKTDGYDYGANFFDTCIAYLRKGGHHKPSMCADLENRCPTEIDFLNKKIVEYGEKYNIPTPYNLVLTHLIKALELKVCK